jgi:membrane protein
LQSFQGAKSTAGTLAVASVLALVWSGTNLFASMEFALNQIYLSATRSFWRNRLMGLTMLGVFLVAVGVSVGVSTATAAAPEHTIVAFIFGALIMAAVLLIIYRYVPNRKSSFSELWPGALAAGVCIELLNFAFPTYVALTHGVATYGRSFGFLFILGTWTYFLSMFLLFGAVMNRMRLDKSRLQSKDQ